MPKSRLPLLTRRRCAKMPQKLLIASRFLLTLSAQAFCINSWTHQLSDFIKLNQTYLDDRFSATAKECIHRVLGVIILVKLLNNSHVNVGNFDVCLK